MICGCLFRLALLCPLKNRDSRWPRTFILIIVSTHSVFEVALGNFQSFVFEPDTSVRLRDDTVPVARLRPSFTSIPNEKSGPCRGGTRDCNFLDVNRDVGDNF